MDHPRRVVLDPNVLVSAAISPSGATAQILDLLDAGVIALVISPALISELTTVLLRPRFRRYLDVETLMTFVLELESHAEFVSDPEDPPQVSVDRDDDYLIALARFAGVEALVSGDPDLLSLTLDDLSILSPRQLLDLVES